MRPRPAQPGRRARIGLTPLIDVVFILLIFFMVASRFAERTALPLDTTAGSTGGPSGAVLVEVRTDGLRLSGEPVDGADLTQRIAALGAARPELRVLLAPAAGVDLQRTVAVLDLLAAAGVRDAALLAGD